MKKYLIDLSWDQVVEAGCVISGSEKVEHAILTRTQGDTACPAV
jgi:hypothetical protein